jgi:predicted esterase
MSSPENPSAALLPRILCLHGGGSNADIFHAQTRFIRYALRGRFEFIFVNGPFESKPGPDILPIFEDCGPYFRWSSEEAGEEEGEATAKVLQRLEQEERIVGLLGFSQGVRVVMGLLLRQQNQPQDLPKDGLMSLRFAVCAMGGISPPLRLLEANHKDIISIPTIHIHGIHDPIYELSQLLLTRHFDPQSTKVLAVNTGHRLPANIDETRKIANMMLEAYYPPDSTTVEPDSDGSVSVVASPAKVR